MSDATGQVVIHDLFATFDMIQLPDAVNEPTLKRLTRFVRDHLGYQNMKPTRYTVRELVSELCKFNTSGTLCWTLAESTCGGGAPDGGHSSTPPAMRGDASTDSAMSGMASTQRVFAHCAQPVVKQVESVLAKAQPTASPGAPKPSVVQKPSSSLDKELVEWLKRLRFEDFRPALVGISSLLDLHFVITEGELSAGHLEEYGLPKFTVKRFIREVQKVRF